MTPKGDVITTHHLRRLAMNGDPDALFRLGYRLAFAKKRPVGGAWTRILELWRKASHAGHARATFHLGVCYDTGLGVTEDTRKAMRLFRKAAEMGHAVAQYNLAVGYLKGEGVRKNLKSAFEWLRNAAQGGSVDAVRDLGVAFFNGWGTARDIREAVHFYRKAAKRGDGIAQYNLGLCYLNGDGVRKSAQLGTGWLRKSAATGFEKAAVKLTQLEQASRQSKSGYRPVLFELHQNQRGQSVKVSKGSVR